MLAISAASGTSVSVQSHTLDDNMLRDRVRLYFKVMFWIEIGYMLLSILFEALGFVPPNPDAPHAIIYTVRSGAMAMLLLGWISCARWRPSRQLLVVMDSLGTILLAGSYIQLAAALAYYGPAFGLLMVSVAFVLRASLIPSSVGRTVAIGVVSVAGSGAVTVTTSTDLPVAVTVWLTIVGLAFVVATAVTSRVIYGLRREVQQAKRLGQYELKRLLGEGGMGVVYEATHVLLRRPTAVKLLPVDKVGEQTLARFEREVQQTSRLEHPNSVYIYDYGHTPDGQFYYAMEYLDGLDLQRLIDQSGPLGEARVRHILLQAAHALAEAHQLGLIHRDIKPANIMLCERAGIADTVKVLDFGLVKEADKPDADGKLTQENVIVGTPHYLAPEAIVAADGTVAASDVYALGAVGYFLLTGREVFEATSVVELCSHHLTKTPTPPSELLGRSVDEQLEQLILRCLAKAPAERYLDGGALADALEALELSDWSRADARDWWQEHRPAAPSVEAPTAGARTQLAIDIGGR